MDSLLVELKLLDKTLLDTLVGTLKGKGIIMEDENGKISLLDRATCVFPLDSW